MGPSGGGKSTAAKLITRFWDVTEGEISIARAILKDLAYSSQTAPDIIGALVIGKLMGGTAAVLTVLFVLRLVKDKRDVPGCGADGHEGGAE